jgi:hypothetical protein
MHRVTAMTLQFSPRCNNRRLSAALAASVRANLADQKDPGATTAHRLAHDLFHAAARHTFSLRRFGIMPSSRRRMERLGPEHAGTRARPTTRKKWRAGITDPPALVQKRYLAEAVTLRGAP